MQASLEVELSSPEAVALAPRLQDLTVDNGKNGGWVFAVTVDKLHISSGSHESSTSAAHHNNSHIKPIYAAVFLPATVTESALDGASDFVHPDHDALHSQRLLHMVHPFLAKNFSIQGILQVRHAQHAPADVALIDLSHTPTGLLDELLQTTSGQVIYAGPELVLKVILIYSLHFVVINNDESNYDADTKPSAAVAETVITATGSNNNNANSTTAGLQHHSDRTHLEIPSCPVCIHRIDPIRLGLPRPDTLQLCSKFCTPPNLWPVASPSGSTGSTVTASRRMDTRVACAQQRLLLPWPSPSLCIVCRHIHQYWHTQLLGESESTTTAASAAASSTQYHHRKNGMVCGACRMQETLWVCMTCGFLGCGRYSNKHAANHFVHSGHPFSLELATLRIWDYVTGGFVQRTDLLECPSSWPLLQPWVAPPSSPGRAHALTLPMPDSMMEKSPKKATMIGEEYEVLLHSALEEQAQHYEGELSRLRAQLMAEHVDKSSMTETEAAQVEELQRDIASLQTEIDRVSRELLDAQSEEAGYRSSSAKLLRQQQVAQDIVQKLEQETAQEQAVGRQQVEELEQQIADLTANQRMRHQFTENEELQQAQIWGMSTGTASSNNQAKGKKGKKQRRARG